MTKEVNAREFFSAAIPDYKATLELNAKLVRALEAIRDATYTGTARPDFEVRREAFQIAQRELVAMGHTPYEWEG